MKKFGWIIIMLFWQCLVVHSQSTLPVSLTIRQTTKPKVVDGDFSDWGTNWTTMSANQQSNTTTAVTAKFQLAYDHTYLWLVVLCEGDVSDDTSTIDIPLVNERDGIDVFLKIDTNSNWKNNGKYIQDDYHLRMKRGSVFPDGFEGPAYFTKPGSGFIIAQVDTGNTYIQEWQVPWDNLHKDTDTAQVADGCFKFEIEATDNTTGISGGASQRLFWQNTSSNPEVDSRNFSLINFTACECEPPYGYPDCLYNCYPFSFVKRNILKNFQSVEPNPTKDFITIKTFSQNKTIVLVYDAKGELKLRENILNGEGKLTLSQLPSGIYFVKLLNQDSKVYKIIKE